MIEPFWKFHVFIQFYTVLSLFKAYGCYPSTSLSHAKLRLQPFMTKAPGGHRLHSIRSQIPFSRNKKNVHTAPLALKCPTAPGFNAASIQQDSDLIHARKLINQVALMTDLWGAAAFLVGESGTELEFRLRDYGLTRQDVRGLLKYFQTC